MMQRITYGSLAAGVAIVVLAINMAGCASLVQETVKAIYGDDPKVQDAVRATAIGMRTYEGVLVQVNRYGDWPKKGTPACAAMRTTLLCRDQAVWVRLQDAVRFASPKVHTARQVIDGIVEDDTGTALTVAAEAIQATEREFLNNAIPAPQVKP